MNNDFLLLGIDGGATKVSGWQVVRNPADGTFSLGKLNSEKPYSSIPGFVPEFKPVDVATQLKERETGTVTLSDDEQQQAAVYVEACAQVIEALVQESGTKRILVGLGMPGLKTEDKRGIAVVANGPRMLDYSDELEKRLALKDIEFVAPVSHIGSDADYCGIGENYSAEGMFRDIDNAYYLGGGTGVADALKLNGTLIPFDKTKEWLAKSWEMKSRDGRSLERSASAGGIQSIYADLSGIDTATLNQRQIYPLQIASLAAKGDRHAQQTYDIVVDNLATLLYERICTLFAGWQKPFTFVNPNRPELNGKHPYQGALLERIIIGQRLGQIFDSQDGYKVVRKPVLDKLDQYISDSDVLTPQAKTKYQNLSAMVVTSRLREAPAIGAGIDAYLHYQK